MSRKQTTRSDRLEMEKCLREHLKEKDQRIAEFEEKLKQAEEKNKRLENMNSRLSQGIYWGNGEHFCSVVSKLKQQLKAQPKQIVKKIKTRLYDNYDCDIAWFEIEKELNTILKEYGEEE